LTGQEFKEKLLAFWDQAKESAAAIWEEIVDRALDLWDSFKRLNKNIQIAIAGGAGFIILILLVIPLVYTPSLPVIAVQNTSGVTGEGNFITVKNTSSQTLDNLNLIMDDKYIYYIEKIGPGGQVKVLNKDFYYRLEKNNFGDQLGQDIVGRKLLVISKKGRTEIILVEKKKGLFGG